MEVGFSSAMFTCYVFGQSSLHSPAARGNGAGSVCLGRGEDERGCFTVKASYNLAKSWNEEKRWEGWRKIWKMDVQQWIKIFS